MSELVDRTFAVAAQLAGWIAEDGARVAIIGAVALAIHGHVRATRDLDLATEVDPGMQLRALAARARAAGYQTQLELPDADDPLGGVLTIRGDDFDPIQIINFHNPFRDAQTPAREALTHALSLPELHGLKVVRAEDLILLKLYAGGLKSLADAQALLSLHPEIDHDQLRRRAGRFELERELERVLED